MSSKLVSWERLVRYIPKGSNQTVRYGDPIVSDSDVDKIARLAEEGKLEVKVLEGDHPLSARPNGETDKVAKLLGPLEPGDVPIIRCIGLNYKTHILETGRPLPTCPTVFTKPAPAVADHGEAIPIPSIAQSQCDYEGELVVVIGKDAKNVSEADALEYVAGYTVGDDVSARDWQREAGKAGPVPQWSFSKSFDKYAPLGPCIVSAKILGEANAQSLKTIVNGEIRQESNTADLCFDVRKLVAFCSQGQTLQRGSLIMTGTPGGVALFMKPQAFLKDGDTVEQISRSAAQGDKQNAFRKVTIFVVPLHRMTRAVNLDIGGPTPSEQQEIPVTVDSPIQHISPDTGEEANRENDVIDRTQKIQPSPSLQQKRPLDMDYSLPDHLPESHLPADNFPGFNLYDDLIGNTVTWPWLHEDLFLSTNPDVFAMPPDPMDFQTTRDIGHRMPDVGLSAIAPPLSTHTLGIQSAESSGNVDFRPAPELVMAGHDAHTEGTLPGGLEDETSNPSSSSASRISLTETATSFTTPAATTSNLQLEQSRIVQELIAFALAPTSGTLSGNERASFWQAASIKVAHAFRLENGSSTAPALYYFCNQHLEHFAPLWPLLSRHSFDYGALHPILFLVVTSIGAMYCGSQAGDYGAMMHSQIRAVLTMAIELEDDEHDFVWLAQARLLTQVAALYFGQPKAFTYAHHLGALLVAQARRNDLFSAVHASKILERFHLSKGVASDDERFGLWLQLETRRRLAFGIFRGDTYTSALLNTKPLVSMEEIDLQLPTCEAVWRSENLSVSLCLQMIEHDQTPSRELWASDVFRIAMENKEPLPPLSPAGQELLMFGLQYPTWRFSRDKDMFARLKGDTEEAIGHDSPFSAAETKSSPSVHTTSRSARVRHTSLSAISDSEAHYLESTVRQMEDLLQERDRLLSTMSKWERSLPVVKTFVISNLDRSSLMSSLILFHLGFIRLLVPLEELHQIQYRMANNKVVDTSLVKAVRSWAKSPQGQIAAERACNIYNIIAKESEVENSRKVRFNLLAFIGLHHSAVLLWAFAAIRGSPDTSDPRLMLRSSRSIPVDKSHTAELLSSFVALYDAISPAKWSSFAKATNTLSNHPFPEAIDT
ncbi:hypothetical protein OPT61_g1251 [Boeremia exigua]|uniref:Uncharacterized protein n=1 Tax=Boeremia exigua TaxID=749465 RepID=A0ACC2IQW0_9PLEO|nr:hypothetical protein OPT61_g1251 [Boeremia exigua]